MLKKIKITGRYLQMNRKNKKAIMIKEILEIILAAAGVFIVALLLYKIISPSFDKDKETAKSYFDTFQEEIKKINSGQEGEFLIWDNENVFLVYFGDKTSTNWFNHRFFAGAHDKNYICMCYLLKDKQDETKCEFCAYLKDDAKYFDLNNKEHDDWAVQKNEKIYISKQEINREEAYVIKRNK